MNYAGPKTGGFEAFLQRGLNQSGNRVIRGKSRRGGFRYSSGPFKGLTMSQAETKARDMYAKTSDGVKQKYENRAAGNDVRSGRERKATADANKSTTTPNSNGPIGGYSQPTGGSKRGSTNTPAPASNTTLATQKPLTKEEPSGFSEKAGISKYAGPKAPSNPYASAPGSGSVKPQAKPKKPSYKDEPGYTEEFGSPRNRVTGAPSNNTTPMVKPKKVKPKSKALRPKPLYTASDNKRRTQQGLKPVSYSSIVPS